MEKFFTVITCILCGFLLADVSADTKNSCQVIHDKFLICKNSTTLLSVNDINTNKSSGVLYIDQTNLTTIAPKAFKDINIIELTIKFKNDYLILKKDSFNGLKMLRSLNIISGIVVVEPNLFFHLKHISYLSIRIDGHKQSLESLGQELLDLKTFTLFNSNLGNINISTFDNFPSGLTQLIFSSENNIKKISKKSFLLFYQLKSLEFFNNSIQYIESQSFAGLHNLENLKIMYEKITDIDNDTFRNLKSLKNLTLSHNKINDIYDKAFHGLNLQLLDLKYNKLTAIKKEMFTGLRCAVLDLSMNGISLIESNSFKNMICQLIFVTNLNIQGGDKIYWGLSNATDIITIGKL